MEKEIAVGIGSGTVVGIVYVVWKLFKHSRCRSVCCGKEASVSVDLEKGGFDSKPTLEKS